LSLGPLLGNRGREQFLADERAEGAAAQSDGGADQHAQDALKADRVEDGVEEADHGRDQGAEDGSGKGRVGSLVFPVPHAGRLDDAPGDKRRPAAAETAIVNEQFERHSRASSPAGARSLSSAVWKPFQNSVGASVSL